MLALFVFMGSGKRDVGRYQAFTSDGATRMIDTKTGEVFRAVKQKTPRMWGLIANTNQIKYYESGTKVISGNP